MDNQKKESQADLLHEFFNHKSDANEFLTATQQEKLEKDFSDWIKTNQK